MAERWEILGKTITVDSFDLFGVRLPARWALQETLFARVVGTARGTMTLFTRDVS